MNKKIDSGARELRRPGVTILELIIVVVIVVALAALGIAGLSALRAKGSREAAVVQKNLLDAGIDEYLATLGGVPEKEDRSGQVLYVALTGDGAGMDGVPCTADDTTPDGSPDQVGRTAFLDPRGKHPIEVATVGSARVFLDPYGRPWRYRGGATANNPQIDIWSPGPDGMDGTADDIKNW